MEQNIATYLPLDNESRKKGHRMPLSFNFFERFGAMTYCQTFHVISFSVPMNSPRVNSQVYQLNSRHLMHETTAISGKHGAWQN
jgi:hypothetical protein